MELKNATPFAIAHFALFDKDGAENIVVVIKATYEIVGATPRIAEEQDPVRPADEYVGEPGKSGLIAEAELVPPRPSTGVTLKGHAIAPAPDTRGMEVSLEVGGLAQRALVFGDRAWTSTLGLHGVSGPLPFERIPLTWENAFGGVDHSASKVKHHEAEEFNPAGKGFLARNSAKKIGGLALPNIEDPARRLRGPKDRPPPIGFLPVAPAWMPRRQYAGTYAEAWQNRRAPLLPDDFDERFHQAAPQNLTAPGRLEGGTPCRLKGVTPGGESSFALPAESPLLKLRFPGAGIGIGCALDNVHFDTDRMRLNLIWRGIQQVHGRLDALQAIEVRLDTPP